MVVQKIQYGKGAVMRLIPNWLKNILLAQYFVMPGENKSCVP